ncbi:sensor histidine kinase KdpD [Schumannella sp. 10F1B-5-1]|uniref:sensor histidine kinase n=1 Tax=Schumannella sp. 10F1B-5-1 TaxID=2590780 RepID=UPI0011308E9E|nr:HAMP domain-containing sensor histidine kinase [Schumannella sp. 10F1B-5-1]TPW72826.1 HAMP domain-containing histidine kinase [Schumannella sp. 10F1B-5-1]
MGSNDGYATLAWTLTALAALLGLTAALIAARLGAQRTTLARQLATVTARLDAERDERARDERVAASRRELAAFLAHDLRDPLSGIVAMSSALADGVADDPQRFHHRIQALSLQLSGMVDDLFELSKIESGTLALQLRPVSLVDVVSAAVHDHRSRADGREIRLRVPRGSDLMVLADGRELGRAVSNLLLNAIQHSPPDAPVTVSADVLDGRPVISVVDSGSGIADDEIARVFETGWRGAAAAASPVGAGASSGGAGLGLAIVRGIAQAHRGDISVRNVPGGCRFEFRLPTDSALTAA